ncbi:hypothetical protein K458DRAFT_82417 [Lentithecium fluviatile CBS 122367]|uniref:Uncharacterized protein n=1 Tax=Lentithecium fluviatile CBS 122367 TaxID=1168545 RepID=A0A6G1ISJ3_9PLEO|nr:hypothetical protein K458DRAFT_82417 [Lentithecium fluviatile CBS 122367]
MSYVNLTQPTWAPPSYLSYDNTSINCSLVADWAVASYTSPDVPIFSTLDLVKQALSKYWDRSNITWPDNGELMGWILTTDSEDPSDFLINATISEKCWENTCEKLEWQKGILISLAVECSSTIACNPSS